MKTQLQSMGVKLALSYLDKDPEKNLLKLFNWVERFDRQGIIRPQMEGVRPVLTDTENNWNQFIRSFWTDADENVRKRFFEDFILNIGIREEQIAAPLREKYGCNIPWAILMDPTSACNLHCTGCWAAEYGNRLSMDLETLDSIVRQGKELGVHLYIYSGGEPLMRKQDILTLCERYPECIFMAFTNATLIDEAFADAMLHVQNFIPAISVEGFEEQTDARRGKGTYQAVMRAMDILREKKLIFGFSACYTRANTDVIGSEEYFDHLIAKGCKFGWFFTYMPIGKDAVPDLMVTPEQREYMYHRIRDFRSTKPLFTMDFWNDGEYVQGCIAGGRKYLHINANGDIEPCAFIHYADCNIHKNTLLEALQSPLFKAYHKEQPFCNNHLRPCPLLDNPGALTKMVQESGAHSTDAICPEDVRDLSTKCKSAAEFWKLTADRLWEASEDERAERAQQSQAVRAKR